MEVIGFVVADLESRTLKVRPFDLRIVEAHPEQQQTLDENEQVFASIATRHSHLLAGIITLHISVTWYDIDRQIE